jgi:glycosyltransferase involved in cell wall biosynthesis
MGLPVLLPRTNVGRFVRHGQEAWVLPTMDAIGIVDTLRMLRTDEELKSRLSAGALAFCEEHFSWNKNAATLEKFYEQVRVKQPEQTHVPSSIVP